MTNTASEAASYEFTTVSSFVSWFCIVGDRPLLSSPQSLAYWNTKARGYSYSTFQVS